MGVKMKLNLILTFMLISCQAYSLELRKWAWTKDHDGHIKEREYCRESASNGINTDPKYNKTPINNQYLYNGGFEKFYVYVF